MDHLLERLWWEVEAEDSLETEATHPSFFTSMAIASVPQTIPPTTSTSLFSVSPYSSQILEDRHSRPKAAAAAMSEADGLTHSYRVLNRHSRHGSSSTWHQPTN